jgi:hypothetical protein
MTTSTQNQPAQALDWYRLQALQATAQAAHQPAVSPIETTHVTPATSVTIQLVSVQTQPALLSTALNDPWVVGLIIGLLVAALVGVLVGVIILVR